MSRGRRAALLVGVVSSLVGILLTVRPTPTVGDGLPEVVRAAPLVLVGAVAILLALRGALADVGRRTDADHTRTSADRLPRTGTRPEYPYPGRSFARRLDDISWADRREGDPKNRLALREEMRTLAVATLARTEDGSCADLEARLDDGSWTDDPDAAAFFADDVVPSLSIRQRLGSLRGGEPPFARRARHAMAELASRVEDADVAPELADVPRRPAGTAPPVTTEGYWSRHAAEESLVSDTERTHTVVAAALVAGGVGVLTLRPGLLLLTLFGVAVAGYARFATPPPDAVEIDRSVGESEPAPGREVEVTVSVENVGDTVLTDVRLVDGVPAGLTVVDGSPRFTTALRPGKKATFTYSVEAVDGNHEFGPTLVVTRDVTGVYRRRTLVSGGTNRVSCSPKESPAADVTPRRWTTILPGGTRSAVSGAGVEFHSLREYRRGDPLSRIDWNRRAKTGEFTTVDFREPRLAKVAVVVDARAEAYLAWNDEGDEPVVRRSVTAGRRIARRLLADDVPVGLTALSPHACWLSPSGGKVQEVRIRDALAGNPAFGWTPPSDEFAVSEAVATLRRRLGPDTQVVLVSPLCDDGATRVARDLDARGHAVTVVSPDPTAMGDPDCAVGHASLVRRFRIDTLRRDGIPVLDWQPNEPFEAVVRRES